MKRPNILYSLLTIICALTLSSCLSEEELPNTRNGNFEALWQILDEHYCFFPLKGEEYGLDWQEVHDRYARQLTDTMPAVALFDTLANMTRELRDGHVNLYSATDVARYGEWFDNYPANYSDSLERITLGRTTDYRQSGGLQYRILGDSIGYVRCESFDGGIGDGNLLAMTLQLKDCCALIVDIRSNGGGQLTEAEQFTSMFVREKTLVGYMQHKTGRGHDDFSDPEPIYVEPHPSLYWGRPVVVLTNRRTYSAANSFAMYMRSLPNVILIGDRTGGGSGMPFSSELPNGWRVRFSASPMYNKDMEATEFGIDPDLKCNLASDAVPRGEGTIIKRAMDFIVAFYEEYYRKLAESE